MTAPQVVARCGECRCGQDNGHRTADGHMLTMRGAQQHKLDCGVGRGDYVQRLPRRDPGRSLRRPDRAWWPERHTGSPRKKA